MPASFEPLSVAAEDVVTGADGWDDAAVDELAAEQPAMRTVTVAARPSCRGERELRKAVPFFLVYLVMNHDLS